MVFERFCDFIADIFQTDKDSLSRETSFSEDLGAEEEDWQEMFMIIEEEFDISLSENDVADIDTLGELSDLIEDKMFNQ
ncbi:MAG: acyl carrier protein [Clostridiales bacterium]|nr:acyl carrier protein [Clostridiales bacterium]